MTELYVQMEDRLGNHTDRRPQLVLSFAEKLVSAVAGSAAAEARIDSAVLTARGFLRRGAAARAKVYQIVMPQKERGEKRPQVSNPARPFDCAQGRLWGTRIKDTRLQSQSPR